MIHSLSKKHLVFTINILVVLLFVYFYGVYGLISTVLIAGYYVAAYHMHFLRVMKYVNWYRKHK